MPFLTFTPARPPDLDSDKKVNFKELSAEFGDGYSQEAADGINADSETFNARWSTLSVAEADTMEAFLRARMRGGEWFYWTAPRKASPQLWKVVKDSFSRRFARGLYDDISVVFEERFEA